MAKQNQSEVQEKISKMLPGNVTQQQLDNWKTEFKEVHIVTVHLNDKETLTGYFKKPNRDVLANCINMANDSKVFEAREFLVNNTFIGGDKSITTHEDAAVAAQIKLWSSLNFLKAEVVKY